LVERLALLAAAVAVKGSAPPGIAQAFARARLSARGGVTYGASGLEATEVSTLLSRALPED
jgi:hypothetical protein